MSEARAPNYELAEIDYMKGMKYKDIAAKYNVTINTVKSWKQRYDWSKDKKKGVHTKDKKVCTQKAGAPKGNKNAVGNDGGAPEGNKNAEKHGFFSKYLPPETKEIFDAVAQADPLDLLWHQIQLAYAAIIRAQQIAYVKNSSDNTIIRSGYKDGKIVGEDFLVQTAIDKQAKFMQAQARAQSELRSLIKQYDEMLHKSWDLATEEQKARIEVMKAKANIKDDGPVEDDGFLDALSGKVDEIWQEE